MFRKLVTLLLVSLCFFSIELEAKRFKVIFLNPGHPQENSTGNFWGNVTRFMEAAANDLDIELVTIFAFRNHILMKSLIEQVVAQKPKYVVIVNEKGIALPMVKQLASRGIASFMLLNNLSNSEIASLTDKEERLLVGSVVPNNYNVGRKLLNDLVLRYQSLNDDISLDSDISLFALRGDYTTPASLARTKGLTDAIKEHKRVIMIDSTVANWSKQQAYQKVKGILRHTKLDIIWTANDAMAFGAKAAVMESKQKSRVMIGGINWDVDDPDYPVSVSYGGHVTLGAKSLAMIKDIENNLLPMNNRHQVIDIFTSSLSPYYVTFTERLKKDQLKHYDFSHFSLSSEKAAPLTIKNITNSFDLLDD